MNVTYSVMRLKKIWGRTTVRGHTNWWKTWLLWNRGKRLLSKIVQENASLKSDRYWTDGQNTALNCTTTRPMEIHQYWTVPRQTQRMATPILRRKVGAAIQSLKKGKSAGVDNIPAKLVQAGGEDVITALTTICNKIWQTGEWPTPWTQFLVIALPKKGSLPELPNNKPHQPHKKSHAEDHVEQIEATSGDHRRRTGRLQSRKECHRGDLQPIWEISPAPAKRLPCLHRLQEGLRRGLACSFVGNHEEVQHQHKPYPSHQKPL